MIFYYQTLQRVSGLKKLVQGVHVTIIYPVMSQGVFLSPTYPAMPRLAFAKGSLTPRAGGSLSPTFVNQQDIAGIQFQPFGGIVMMEFQDFDYE